MNQIIKKIDNIASASVDDLKRELGRALDITADYIRYLGEIWRELESRGEDLSELRHGLLAYLPLVANNTVDPRLIINYAGQKTLLAALARLPIKQQQDIADSGYVSIAKETNGEGKFTEVQVKLTELKANDIYTIFGEDRIRTPAEQIKLKKSLNLNTRIKNPNKEKIKIDPENDSLIIRGMRIPREDIANALWELAKEIEKKKNK
ncbi:hypothetical protein [Photorhabdus luminescens]|uniref:hypothetical protein n=1 Tax=Photorhabdus luminescens TaxID=29488 RepID=UPI00223F2B65|nr:hypothetical protein [Photorhabdus luminescens]MCW7763391.1 hypothetical protein [Photorhabdus luminescens subsp. venezuelensis]